ncbi:hypothetical protein ACIQNI_34150 [Streptomyces sp. NPDC091266]|uniref:hypothetical protein n=1 Tax=Streptomyces sp. NPDC091266 TaxID=3365978 RepID=UPI0037F75F3A
MPQHADRQEIRLRITGTNNPQQDNADLKAWLEREPWLARRPHEWEQRARPDDAAGGADRPGRGDMAVGVDDLILVVVGAAAAEVAKGLGIALREWLRRRREERAAGEQPALEAGGGGGGLRQVGDGLPHGAAPGRPDPGSPAAEGGNTPEG